MCLGAFRRPPRIDFSSNFHVRTLSTTLSPQSEAARNKAETQENTREHTTTRQEQCVHFRRASRSRTQSSQAHKTIMFFSSCFAIQPSAVRVLQAPAPLPFPLPLPLLLLCSSRTQRRRVLSICGRRDFRSSTGSQVCVCVGSTMALTASNTRTQCNLDDVLKAKGRRIDYHN